MNQESKIDELFSEGLSQPEIRFMEADWADMKQKLKKDKKRRGIIWWTSGSGIAAALLVALAWWGLPVQPDITTVKVVKTPAVKPTETNVLKSGEERVRKIGRFKPIGSDIVQPAVTANMVYYASLKSNTSKFPKINSQKINEAISVAIAQSQPILIASQQKEDSKKTAPLRQSDNPNAPQSAATVLIAEPETKVDAVARIDSSRIIAKTKSRFKPSLILSLTAAPDLSAVRSFTNNKLGFNSGLVATVTVSPRLSISSGAVLAKKVYETAFENYNPNGGYIFPANPINVNADCRVLDIPLNINFIFFQKNKSSLQLSAGASSYIMLTEKYQYEYVNKYSKGPDSYEVRNLNQHYLGIGNIAVAYQQKLNASTAISIQPYLKVPLTDIGYGNVKLLSTGVAVNLDINFSTIIKRK